MMGAIKGLSGQLSWHACEFIPKRFHALPRQHMLWALLQPVLKSALCLFIDLIEAKAHQPLDRLLNMAGSSACGSRFDITQAIAVLQGRGQVAFHGRSGNTQLFGYLRARQTVESGK